MLPTVAKIQIDIAMTLGISCPSERPGEAVVMVVWDCVCRGVGYEETVCSGQLCCGWPSGLYRSHIRCLPLLPSTPVSSKHTKAIAASKKGWGKGRGGTCTQKCTHQKGKKERKKKLPSFVGGLKERRGTVAAVAPAQDIWDAPFHKYKVWSVEGGEGALGICVQSERHTLQIQAPCGSRGKVGW